MKEKEWSLSMIFTRLFKNRYRWIQKSAILLLGFLIMFQSSLTALADMDLDQESEYRKTLPVQSNQIQNWPTGPVVGAQSAILMEANSGTILYEKNIHEKLYPASTTKMMTCLLAVENCALDEMVTFSKEAVFGIEQGSSNAGIDVGEQISMEECLYIILMYSANEVTAGVGEHVAGSIDAFVDKMNERAKELGCLNTHFNNSNGLPDENHYTTAYDLALIAREFYKNETLQKISSTSFYTVYPTSTQPDQWDMQNHHKLCKNLSYEYEGFIGGKTGYTNVARQTLVSGAQRNGMRLICVVLKEESPYQFTDTISLFDYGFHNFTMFPVAENDTTYTMGNTDFFNTNSDIFGSSKQIISIDPNDYIVLPNTADFSDTTSKLIYDNTTGDEIATVSYQYHGVNVGTASIKLASDTGEEYDFDSPVIEKEQEQTNIRTQSNVIFINVIKVLRIILLAAGIFIVACFIKAYLNGYHFGYKKRKKNANKSTLIIRKKPRSPYYKKKNRKDRDLHF